MPPAGREARGEQQATLARIRHERLISDELGRLVDEAAAETDGLPYESDEASLVRVDPPRVGEGAAGAGRAASRDHADMPRSPSTPGSRPGSDSDYAGFLPYLERNVELKRRYAECFEGFDGFEHRLRPAARRLRAGDDHRGGARRARRASRRRPPADRRDRRAAAMPSTTPACMATSRSTDQAELCARGRGGAAAARRVPGVSTPPSIRSRPRSPRPTSASRPASTPSYIGTALWSVIHEAGHALYENGIARELVALAAVQPVVAGLPRVPEPPVGELGGPRAALPGAPPAAASRAVPRRSSAT